MALSEEERRLLEQMEAALAAEDPKFAHALRGGASNRRLRRRRAALAGLGFVLGAVMLVAGIQTHWVVSVLGFVAMLASTVVAITSFEKVENPQPAQPGPRVSTGSTNSSNAFMDKMEERWKKRQEDN
ncbi:spore wall synthesis complex protein [Mariniluteicoccus endophyticus]